MAVRIVLADDHSFVRRELRRLLEAEEDWLVCGEADDGSEAVRLCDTLRPDIAALDISMPVMDGLNAAKHIRKMLPPIAIVIVSMHMSEVLIAAAIDAGARAYVSKSDAARHLVPAVRTMLQSNTTYFASESLG